jgi:hypothetical protein
MKEPSMDAYEKIIRICREMAAESNLQAPALFDAIAARLVAEGVCVDQAATQAVRTTAPNSVVVVKTDDILDFIKMDRKGDFDLYGYCGPDCDTQLVSAGWAMNDCDEDDPDRITEDDLHSLRFVLRDDKKYFDEDDITDILIERKEAREERYEEQRTLNISLPDEFLLLCEQYNLTPALALRGFIADVCGIESFTNPPTIPHRTDGYNSNGSDERDMARRYFDRAHWSPEVEEKHGISLHY